MHTLILLRHAKAVPGEEAASDEARPLSPRGHKDADAAGAAIAALDLAVTHALVSPAARTKETAAAALPHLGGAQTVFRPSLYMASPQTVFAEAIACGGDSVLVIAHNPGLHELVIHLLDAAHDWSRQAQTLRGHFPTSAFAAFALTGDTFKGPGARLLHGAAPRG